MKDRLVYSTDSGRICPDCGQPVLQCNCKAQARSQIKGDGRVRLRKETKGRGGKMVSIISGLALNQSQLITLVSELKRRCGAGGTLKDGEIEIQGDHLDVLRNELNTRGIKFKG